eukprot:2075596-Prymnesium_polylepis.1
MDKHAHQGNTNFEDLCHRSHTAPWGALGEAEPEWWEFRCPSRAAQRCARRRRAPSADAREGGGAASTQSRSLSPQRRRKERRQ